MQSHRDTNNPSQAKLQAERDSLYTRYCNTGNFGKKCALWKQIEALDKQIKELNDPSNINISPLSRQIALLENKVSSLNTRHAVSGNFGTRNGIWEEKEGVEIQIAGLKAESLATTPDEITKALQSQLTGLEKQHKGLVTQSQCTGNFYEKNSLCDLSSMTAKEMKELETKINSRQSNPSLRFM